jgi:hypothetical protein
LSFISFSATTRADSGRLPPFVIASLLS